MAASKQLRAIASFVADVNGEERIVREGDVLKDSDPVVKGREEMFEAA
jgi:hypothetical protein